MSQTYDNHATYDANLHDSQMVAVYESMAEAESARAALLAAGVSAHDVEVISTGNAAGTTTTSSGTDNEGFWGAVKNLFAPEDDYNTYHTALGRGHAMVSVTPTGVVDRAHLMDVLERTNPIDIDAKRDEWGTNQTAGMTGTPSGALSGSPTAGLVAPGMSAGVAGAVAGERAVPAVGNRAVGSATGATAPGGLAAARTGMDDKIQVVQERLRVGKREVSQGNVRVRSYVVERPVEEQVRLHEERVSIERRPVDRPVTGAEAGLFQERTIEARSMAEEAVVSKEARVVEEIGLNKQASDRTETVRDTVRETKVDIEDETAKLAGKPIDTTKPRI